MIIRKLDDILTRIREKEPKTVIGVCANDDHTLLALDKAVSKNLINTVLIGNEQLIRVFFKRRSFNQSRIRIINQTDEKKAISLAIEMIYHGEGDVLMKGLISTDHFIKALLDKDRGLTEQGSLLSHLAVIENKNYHKLLIAGDVAVIPNPSLSQKETIIKYLIHLARKFGIEYPKVAIIAPTEKIVPSIVSTIEAETLRKLNLAAMLEGCIIEGPLALDVALDTESALTKGLDNPVAGDADCLLFANIDAGNVFYKTNTKLAGSEAAAVLMGTKIPVVLPSRGDSVMTKLYSTALAAMLCINEKEGYRSKRNKEVSLINR